MTAAARQASARTPVGQGSGKGIVAAAARRSDEAHDIHVSVSQIPCKIAAVDPAGGLAGLIVAEPGVRCWVGLPDADRS